MSVITTSQFRRVHKTQIHTQIHQLAGEKQLPAKAVARLRVQATPLLHRVQTREERAIQPATTLPNQDVQVGRDISRRDRRVHYALATEREATEVQRVVAVLLH